MTLAGIWRDTANPGIRDHGAQDDAATSLLEWQAMGNKQIALLETLKRLRSPLCPKVLTINLFCLSAKPSIGSSS